ncbi:geranylgeranyl pyrophosphate synthase [Spirochaetia bacterium]|nr:geranylgeranyl pyrophosphate synthase [Spirochaetia bacterium]
MTSFWQDFPGIPEALEKVSGIIQNSSASQNSIVSRGLGVLFDGNGKLLRPGLLLIAAEFGKVQDKHYNLAACLEILHMATLIHDDVIDDSPLRRGAPAVHTQFGKRDAVLIGDYLLSRCILLAAKYTSAENAANIARLMSVMCVMEIEQNSDRFSTNLSLRRYLRKIMGKSAGLFSLACHVGAYEAKVSRALTEQLRRIGYNMGMAFQIIDDILDYSGDPGAVRKPLGNDIKEGLITLPLICAIPRDTSGTLKSLFAGETFFPNDTPAILTLVRDSGGVDLAKQHAEAYTRRALRGIAELPAGKGRNMLDKLTRSLLIRDR